MRHSWTVLAGAVVFSACGQDESIWFSSDAVEAGSEAGAGGSGSSGGSAGTAGSGGSASAAGSGSIDAGTVGDASQLDGDEPEPDGAAGVPGDSGSTDAAKDGSDGMDAGTDACARPTVYYRDKDRDRYGSKSSFVTACSPPPGNWSLTASDCNDDDGRVHPGQAAYFGTPYRTPSGASSFDYDCSGSEEEDPAADKAPENCGLFSLALCGGEGYVKTARTGPGLSSFCGSEELSICSAALVLLVCETVIETAEEPFRCR